MIQSEHLPILHVCFGTVVILALDVAEQIFQGMGGKQSLS